MLLEVDLTGVPVMVVGLPADIAAAVRRLTRAGAVVSVVHDPRGVVSEGARLVVAVGAASEWLTVSQLRGQYVVVDEPAPVEPVSSGVGRVVLVGAGPGGAGLLTLDAVHALADADVVLTDRLASIGDLSRYAPGAEVIDVGKRPGHHAVPQGEIEALMVDRAVQGLTVVRLKGGDPYVFGRGGEEVAACVAAGVPVTVVPGVSSAIAVPGTVGIPITHRGVSHAFTVVSGHEPLTAEQAKGLAAVGGTVVVLMGVHNLVPITTALLSAGFAADAPTAIVERGLTPDARSLMAPLDALAESAMRAGVASPAVIVIGEVVRQSQVWAQRVVDAQPLSALAHAQAQPQPQPNPATHGRQPGVGEQAQRHTATTRHADWARALTGARA